MRIWHFKLRIIRRYAAYLGHWVRCLWILLNTAALMAAIVLCH